MSHQVFYIVLLHSARDVIFRYEFYEFILNSVNYFVDFDEFKFLARTIQSRHERSLILRNINENKMDIYLRSHDIET